jgi:hypothetical protein
LRPAATGREDGDDEDAPRPAIDISSVDGRADLSPAQSAAVQKYKEARRRYDVFVAENAALVKQMDTATGPNRIKLLDTLRQRKGEEPPVRAALKKAEDALLAAFPEAAEPEGAAPKSP